MARDIIVPVRKGLFFIVVLTFIIEVPVRHEPLFGGNAPFPSLFDGAKSLNFTLQ